MKKSDYEKQKIEEGNKEHLTHAQEYIRQLENGERRGDYAFGDPNCRSFEIDYMSPENQQREHEAFMKQLDKVQPIVDKMRNQGTVEDKKLDR